MQSGQTENSKEGEYTHLLCRVASEIFLKGKNQNMFILKLARNARKLTGQTEIHRRRARLLLPYFEDHHLLKRVFGLHSYSPAIFLKKEEDAEINILQIKKIATKLLNNKKGTFHVQTKRSDKSFPLTSVELNRVVGETIEEKNKNLEFKLKKPEHVLGIEITDRGIFLYTNKIPCLGGLPAGVEGDAAIQIKNKSSLLAALLMIKRGVTIAIITEEQKIKKKQNEEVISSLQEFSPKKLRRFCSVRSYKEWCGRRPCVIVTNNTIKTMNNLVQEKDEIKDMLFLHPLISYSKEQIGSELKMYKEATMKNN